jgi:hypothetical protein
MWHDISTLFGYAQDGPAPDQNDVSNLQIKTGAPSPLNGWWNLQAIPALHG